MNSKVLTMASDNRNKKDSHSIVLIMGFDYHATHFTESLRECGLEVFNQKIDTGLEFYPNTSYYFFSNFRNLLTSYEKEFLGKYPFVKNVVAIDPDFDEYEDVAVEFEKRYKDHSLIIYDERVFSEKGKPIYSKDQLDFVRSCMDAVCATETARKVGIVAAASLHDFAEDLKKLGKKHVEDFCWKMKKDGQELYAQVDKFQLQKTNVRVDDEKSILAQEVEKYEAKMNKALVIAKVVSVVLFLLAIGLNILAYTNFELSYAYYENTFDVYLFAAEHKWNLILFTSIFTTLQLSLIVPSFIIKHCLIQMRTDHDNYLAMLDKLITKNFSDVDSLEKFQEIFSNNSFPFIQKFVVHIEENKLEDLIENSKKQKMLELKKAA